jgi:protein SCO1
MGAADSAIPEEVYVIEHAVRFSRPAVTGLIMLVVATSTMAGPEERRYTLDQPIVLIDAEGRSVSSGEFSGKWALVYFGYTHCADLCPTALSTMALALEEIAPANLRIQPLFVTVDPERDKGDILRIYPRSFDARMIGLGGSVKDVAAAAKALGVSFEKVQQSNSGYTVDHSSVFTVIEPSGRLAITINEDVPHQLAARLLALMERAGERLEGVNLGAFR